MKRKLPKLSLMLVALSLVWKPGIGQGIETQSMIQGSSAQLLTSPEHKVSLQVLLQTLQKHFKVNIIFEDNAIKGQFSTVDIDELKQGTIEEALDQTVIPLGLTYRKAEDNNFIIKSRKAVYNDFQESAVADTAKFQVKGIITDASNAEPLPGVTVQLKGTSKGTVTDKNGNYAMDITNTNSVLVFSFLGFKSKEINVGCNSVINLALEMNSQVLKEIEVVEVGYGTQKKEAITGSVATISNKAITQMPSINLGTALTGNTPGLIIAQKGGAPGNESNNILIRSTSLLASPLVVVDGVVNTTINIGGSNIGLNNIDPNDVESVTVLKDIASTSIYGARGANGVILITTKRGKESPAKFNFSSSTTFSQPTQLPKFLNGYQQALLENERSVNSGSAAVYSDADLEIIRTGSNPDRFSQTNWAEQGLKNFSNGQNYNLNVSGGSDKVKYYLGGGLNQQTSLLKVTDDDNFKRYSFLSNLDAKIAKNLNISADVSYRNENTKTPYGGFGSLYGQLFSVSPLQPVTFSNGLPAAFLTSAQNPIYGAQNNGYMLNEGSYFAGKFKAKLTIPFVKGLSIDGLASFDRSTAFNKNFSTPFKIYRADAKGIYNAVTGVDSKGNDLKPTLSETFTKSSFNTYNISLNYARTFQKHSIAGLFLYEATETFSERLQAGRSNIFSSTTDQLFAGDANITNSGVGYETGRAGYVGRLNYNYAGKYYLEGSFRYEASTNFPVDHRWGFFPSVAGAWRISEENFIKNNVSFLNSLKLRASYGMAGDEYGSGYSAYQAGYNVATNGYIWNGVINTSVSASTSTINPNFTWAKVRSYNVGFDFELWRGLLSGVFDIYKKEAYDLLTPMNSNSATVPLSFGATAPKQNQGKTHTNGFELSLTHRNQLTKNWAYSITGNISKAKSIIDYSGEAAGLPEWDVNRYNGLGANTDRFYKSMGLFQNQAEIDAWPTDQDGQKNKTIKPGDIKYADLNGDGLIDTKDVYVVDNSTIPVINYAFTLGTSYKNISLDMAFVGVADYTNNNLSQTWANFDERQLDRWSVDNPNASWPRLANSANNARKSDFYGTDGSYLRLRSIQLNYAFPKKLINHIGLDALSIFAQGGNLLTFSKVKFMDPENNNNWGYYGPQRTFAMGLNVRF